MTKGDEDMTLPALQSLAPSWDPGGWGWGSTGIHLDNAWKLPGTMEAKRKGDWLALKIREGFLEKKTSESSLNRQMPGQVVSRGLTSKVIFIEWMNE